MSMKSPSSTRRGSRVPGWRRVPASRAGEEDGVVEQFSATAVGGIHVEDRAEGGGVIGREVTGQVGAEAGDQAGDLAVAGRGIELEPFARNGAGGRSSCRRRARTGATGDFRTPEP